MKLAKTLGLLFIAAAALTALAGSASADVVRGGGTPSFAAAQENGHLSIHGNNGVTIECAGTLQGAVTGHSAGKPVTGPISSLSFLNCTNGVIGHVKANGTLSASATGGGGSASLSWSGGTLEFTSVSIFGTITCIYTTSGTSIGTLTGSDTTKSTATLDVSASLPRTGGSALCGSSGVWTGAYKFSTPDTLNIDKS